MDAVRDPLLQKELNPAWRDATWTFHRCPGCLDLLTATESPKGLVCAGCGEHWPVVGGLPFLTRERRHYHADVPEHCMRELLRDTPAHGWRLSFAKLLAKLDASKADVIARNVLDSARSLGVSLLPLKPDAHVLDVGCGWGSLSVPLAESGVSVMALDLAPLRARFAQLRAAEDGLTNLSVAVGGDTRHLPFGDGLFDAVILNGVLEWVAVSQEGKPRDVQHAFLSEVRRLLKPEGLLYLGIENRLSHLYLRGRPEDHVELPFVALLPRRVADVWARHRLGRPYRTHTHTASGYRRLLARSGFGEPRFFYPHPDYRAPVKLIPLHARQRIGMLYGVVGRSQARRVILASAARLGLLALVGHSFVIVARRPAA